MLTDIYLDMDSYSSYSWCCIFYDLVVVAMGSWGLDEHIHVAY